MLAVCARHGHAKLLAPPPLAGERVTAWVVGRCCWRPAAARRGVVAARASFFGSRIGLDSQVRWSDRFMASCAHRDGREKKKGSSGKTKNQTPCRWA
ncbi:hypothetical protein GUJ93_ZPchr0007g3614 [Zizania palustris]|uniref:Uncharacterized protein n=1 Tax=Zizania palustris TaxID=103762 RepID=A0A8J5VMT9_ZIZPA|nr:hypothetical protein GUJ93_ZPchr0007g3614 [Zizania palustris]